MADPKFLKFDTQALHAGQQPDPATGARAVLIYQTTSYVFRDTDHAAALFNLERARHIYSRISNPTVAVLEERVAALEFGVGAVGTASGQAALHLGIVTLMSQGAHVVASASLYDGSVNVFAHTMPRFGIETSFVKPRDLDGIRAAIRPETRLIYAETLGNPGLEVLDIPAVAEIAHAAGLPLMIDNTFATPHLCNPIELGADIVLHSATKWLGGHGLAIGGVLVDGGRFDWEKSGKFPTLANVGDAKTLVLHPASTTHQQMSAGQLATAGVGEDMVRLSVGIEDPDDIIADLRQALRASQRGPAPSPR